MKRLQHSNTSVTNIGYHIIWCPKYRRKVLIGDIKDRLFQILPEIALNNQCTIESLEIMPDHVHVFLKGVPTLAIHQIIQRLKGISSNILKREFPKLKTQLPCLWTRSYYCETIGCISEDAVMKYIENQQTKALKSKC